MSRQEQNYFDSRNIAHSDTTMRMMLDADDLLREIELFIKGYYKAPIYDEATKTTKYELIQVGKPKANEEGVQSIMFWLRSKINPLISMGNISTEQYSDYLERARVNLSRNLMVHRNDYDISLGDYTEIIDNCMECFEAFFTSSIRAGHRGAFTRNTTVESKEVIEQDKKKMFGVF